MHISCMSCVSSENLALPNGKFTVDAIYMMGGKY